METCGMNIVKFFLFIFNLIFAVSGLVILTAGAVVLANIDEYSAFLESRVVGPPIVLIVAGLIIFAIAFLGCWGALRENYKMLLVYAVLLLVICIIELAVGITAAVVKDNLQEVLNDAMQDSMKHYTDEENHKYAWDSVQRKLKCCGASSAHDWKRLLKPDNVLVPSSCCKMLGECDNKTVNELVWQEGCYEKLRIEVKDSALILAGIALGIAFIELAGIVLALILVYSIRTNNEEK